MTRKYLQISIFIGILSLLIVTCIFQYTSADSIPTIDQFTSTTSPATAITQRTYGKSFRLSGQSSGCAQFDGNGTLTSSGSSCGGGVTSITDSSGSLSFVGSTGAVNGSINTSHANSWGTTQSFLTGIGGGINIGSSQIYEPTTGLVRVIGSLTATVGFSGDGSNLTSLPAGQLTGVVATVHGGLGTGTWNDGSIPYYNSSALRMAQDNSNLFWDSINHRLGLSGSTTPDGELSIGSSDTSFIDLHKNATSTFAQGINLENGCFAIGNTCITSSSGTVNSGIFGQATFYGANGTAVSGTSTLVFGTTTADANNIGIGTTSPFAKLSIQASSTLPALVVRGATTTNSGSIATFYGSATPLLTLDNNTTTTGTAVDAHVSVTCTDTTDPTNLKGCFQVKNAGRNLIDLVPRLGFNQMDLYLGNSTESYVFVSGPAQADLARLDLNATNVFFNAVGATVHLPANTVFSRLGDATNISNQFASGNIDQQTSAWDTSLGSADFIDFFTQAKPLQGLSSDIVECLTGRNIAGYTGCSFEIENQDWRNNTHSGDVGINIPINTRPTAHLDIREDDTTRNGPIVKLTGVASQTQPYLSILNSAGSSIFNATSTGNVGIGTSTPYATTSIQSNSSTGDAFVVATSSKNAVFGIDNDGHRFTSGPTPAITNGTDVGDDQGGTITTNVAVSSVTMTFSKAYRNTPYCKVTDDSLTISADVSSISTTAVTFSLSAPITTGHLYYECAYHQ